MNFLWAAIVILCWIFAVWAAVRAHRVHRDAITPLGQVSRGDDVSVEGIVEGPVSLHTIVGRRPAAMIDYELTVLFRQSPTLSRRSREGTRIEFRDSSGAGVIEVDDQTLIEHRATIFREWKAADAPEEVRAMVPVDITEDVTEIHLTESAIVVGDPIHVRGSAEVEVSASGAARGYREEPALVRLHTLEEVANLSRVSLFRRLRTEAAVLTIAGGVIGALGWWVS
ncbi:MAG: hypothetical protein AAGE52_08235 [Myxococcota bacterium]